MIVIKHGNKYIESATTTCDDCDCVFSFNNDDIERAYGPNNYEYATFVCCPECKEKNYIDM